MICYTNHALDQFLSSIIEKLSLEPGQIVRVGGRSRNPIINPFLIQELRLKKRDIRLSNQELAAKYEILNTIKKQMDDYTMEYYQCSEQLLDANQLLRVMDRSQFLTLIEPILFKLDIFRHHWNSNNRGIYCCNSIIAKDSDDDDDDSSDSSSESENQSVNLSFDEKEQRRQNRIICQKLNKLSDNDRKEINRLLVKWLDATQSQIIVNQMKEKNESIQPCSVFLFLLRA